MLSIYRWCVIFSLFAWILNISFSSIFSLFIQWRLLCVVFPLSGGLVFGCLRMVLSIFDGLILQLDELISSRTLKRRAKLPNIEDLTVPLHVFSMQLDCRWKHRLLIFSPKCSGNFATETQIICQKSAYFANVSENWEFSQMWQKYLRDRGPGIVSIPIWQLSPWGTGSEGATRLRSRTSLNTGSEGYCENMLKSDC